MKKEQLEEYLNAKPNDVYRKTIDTKDPMYIYDNAINTAKKVVLELGSNILRTNHVILSAKMQSGKTSVANSVINIINRAKLYKDMAIHRYMFITGMNDCGLKSQTYERLLKQVIGANIDNTYIGKRSKKNETLGGTNRFFVLKNSDLLSYDGILDNSLIFIDESHYGSNERNILSKFLEKHHVDWKDTNDLIKRNIYIVSISATDFDEMVSDKAKVKKIIELHTDDSYVGVSDYLGSNLIFDANLDDIQEEGAIFDYIMDAHDRMLDNDENGVIIIRTRKFDIIEEHPYVATNFNVFEMYASGSKIQYDKLNSLVAELVSNNRKRKVVNMLGFKTKDKPLLVLIKGAYRAGITLPSTFKDITYMLYDYSACAAATCQALLGRMCGYRSNRENINKTYLYINKKFADMYSAWSDDMQNYDLIPADKCSYEWVDDDYTGNDVKFASRSLGNFSIDLTDDEIRFLYKKRVAAMKAIVPGIFRKHNIDCKYDYLMECYMSGKNSYTKSTQEKRFNSFESDVLVFAFRPDKIKEFNGTELTKENIGDSCISLVLDAEIYDGGKTIAGNKRLLVYYVGVGQKKLQLNRSNQYKKHKDTSLIEEI